MKSVYIMMKVNLIAGLALLAALAAPVKSWAIAGYGDAFRSRYPSSPITSGGCNTCVLCHSNAANPETTNLYNYGIVWRAEWDRLQPGRTPGEPANANAVAAFTNIEGGDADGDGQSNGAEIAAGTNTSGAGNVCPAGGGSGGNRTLSSFSSEFNPNALNSDCSFQEGGAAMGTVQNDPVHVVTRLLLFLLPLLCGAYLKSLRRQSA